MAMKQLLENFNRFLSESADVVDVGTSADDEVAVCRSAIGCEDFKTVTVDEAAPLEEQMSGQQSERNLVDAINRVTQEGPVSFDLGALGVHPIAGAAQLGGGNPEPKADIKIITASGKEIGISMKKENFGFFQNRMDESKLRQMLVAAGMETPAQDLLVAEMKEKLAEMTLEQSAVLQEEKDTFLKIVSAADPSYKFPNLLLESSPATIALIQSQQFGKNGNLKNSYKIRNVYLHLSDVMGENYKDFLTMVCAGTSENPFPAQAVLIADVPPEISTTEEIQLILGKIKSIPEMVRYYANDENINLKFRLRPITRVRTTYSKSNRSHYKKGIGMYEDPTLGVSWTVFVT
tara:strand:- start:13 stop:1056 length:1044 start_codon:yes stop_codon:yes gene_type:complete